MNPLLSESVMWQFALGLSSGANASSSQLEVASEVGGKRFLLRKIYKLSAEMKGLVWRTNEFSTDALQWL